MTTQTAVQSVTLYYREGSSDKVYHIEIEPEGDGFVVNFAFGRRGLTLSTGSKTPSPVDLPAARKIFDKLVKEKTGKGYSPGEDGTPYQGTERESRSTGVVPQLLNPIDEAEAEKLIADPGWWAQEKFDGRRVLIRRSDDQVTGINRLGLAIALPAPLVQQALMLGCQQWLMDGECIGDNFYAFDLLENACIDLRAQPYSQRLKTLLTIVASDDEYPLRSVETALTVKAKRQLFTRLKEQHREGIVFKRHIAPFTPGRPASGGDQLKCKFTATASCIVAGANGSKRSVKLELIDGGRRVAVGNVAIPPSQPIPGKGDIIEVRYLYAYPGGALFQPVYLGKREDVADDACTVSQLKFKSASDESDDGQG